jgi:outer membrane protein assembly factor BamB
VRLESDWSFEPWPDEFVGEVSQAGRVLGERVPASRVLEERRFACLDLASRSLMWTLDEPRVRAPRKRFWTMSDQIAVAYQEPQPEKYDVYRLKDGKLLWSLKVRKSGGNEYPLRPVVISEGVLFHADREDAVGHVHALDAKTGKPLWSFKDRDFSTPGESFISNIIGTKGLIWVALYGKKQCRLTAIDKAKGKRVWSMDTKTLGWLRFIDDAIVCIQGRKLVCFRSEAAG